MLIELIRNDYLLLNFSKQIMQKTFLNFGYIIRVIFINKNVTTYWYIKSIEEITIFV